MNFRVLFKLMILLLFLNSCREKGVVDISLNLPKECKKVFVSIPINNNYFSGAFTQYQVQDRLLNVTLDNIDKANLIKISDGQREVYIIVSPEEKYSIDFREGGVDFGGKNAEGNSLLNNTGILHDPKYYLHDIDKCGNGISKLEYIAKKERQYKEMFDSLYKRKIIDKEFRDIVYNQIKSYFETMFSTSMFFQFRLIENNEDSVRVFLDDELPVWGSIYKNINDKKYLLQSNLLYNYTFRYIEYLDLLNYQHLVFERNHFNNMRHLLNLSGSFLEYAWAETMYTESQNNLFEKIWIDSYNDFCKEYPNSKLKKWIEPIIDRITTYHKNAEIQDVDVVFNDKEINSVEELGEVLKGQISYVDIWSTGCAPCREELQYSLKNHEKLKELGVQSVYISLDYHDKSKWEEMVKSLPLKGLNILASKSLYKDFFEKLDNFNGIPRYLVLGEDGKIIDDLAPRPSSEDKLLEYFEKKIKDKL